ncbi:unnamed protein product [Soboliphyme baturini]|uniref:Selenoprotein O n=1 Tax=Soboliphyme baturini TaxID=241478 RepID=A0A183IB49_9BILA|nr:unnamed protein product [Soboliphyme baturini]
MLLRPPLPEDDEQVLIAADFSPACFSPSTACAALGNPGDDRAGIIFYDRNSVRGGWLSLTGDLDTVLNRRPFSSGFGIGRMAELEPSSFEGTAAGGLKVIRHLRLSVCDIFEYLELTPSDKEGRLLTDEATFSNELKKKLQNVLDNFELLDKCATTIQKQNNYALTENVNILLKNYTGDQLDLYPSALSVYNWITRAKEHCNWSYLYINPMTRRNQSKCARRFLQPSFLQVSST